MFKILGVFVVGLVVSGFLGRLGLDPALAMIGLFLIVGIMILRLFDKNKKIREAEIDAEKTKRIDLFNNVFQNEMESLIKIGSAPALPANFVLQKSELLVGVVNADIQEFKTTEINYLRTGARFKIGKNYSVGSGSIKMAKKQDFVTVSKGELNLTDKKLLMISGANMTTIELRKIIKLDLMMDGAIIFYKDKKTPFALEFDDTIKNVAEFEARLQYYLDKINQ